MSKAFKLGGDLEKAVVKILESWGTEAYRPPKARFSRRRKLGGVDLFGADILAKSVDEPWSFIQVSTRDNLSHKKRQLEAGLRKVLHENIDLDSELSRTRPEVWVWDKEKKKFVVYGLTGEQHGRRWEWKPKLFVTVDGNLEDYQDGRSAKRKRTK